MKKVILSFLIFLLITFSAFSQDIHLISYKTAVSTRLNSSWGDWSEKSTHIYVTIKQYTRDILIFTEKAQKLVPLNNEFTEGVDEDGEHYIKWSFVDDSQEVGRVTFLERTNGRTQMYVQYDQKLYVYNLRRRN
jgi:hypothetical protein